MPLGLLRFTNALGGTANFIYPGPTIDMQSPASAGAVNGTTYLYYAQSLDMMEWEIGNGAYTSSSGTFARTTITANSLGTTAKINFTNPPQVIVLDSASSLAVREKLIADRTYYVRADGNDGNTGLVDSAGGAFLTVQKAVNTVCSIDFATFQVTIQVRNGTYTGVITLGNWVGANIPIIQGDLTTPSNIVLTASSNDLITSNAKTAWLIMGVKLTTTGAGRHALRAENGSLIQFGNVEFGACTGNHLYAVGGGMFDAVSGYTISGGASIHAAASSGGRIRCSVAITLTGTPAFSSAFVDSGIGSIARFDSATFAGAATGQRYNVSLNGVIISNGGAFPGSVAGVSATGGQYS